LYENGSHIYAGDLWQPPANTGEQPIVGPSESFVYELLSTVTGTVNFSGRTLWEESGG
jgi:hypothetical protein